MSVMDKLKDMLKGHPDQARAGLDKAGQLADEKTGGKYSGQTDAAKQKIEGQLGINQNDDQTPQQ